MAKRQSALRQWCKGRRRTVSGRLGDDGVEGLLWMFAEG